jgi:sugar/nucleoside kinase (ribokinase family)
MAPSFDVIVLGDYCLDLIFTGLDEMPRLGKEVVARGFAMTPGGAYNTVAALHRLGVRVGWPADFGEDDFSRFILEKARQEGLDHSLFIYHKRPLRYVTVAASFPHDRAFLAYYDPTPGPRGALRALATATARLVLVAGMYTGRLFGVGSRLARARGMKLAMDGNTSEEGRISHPAVRNVIRGLDLLLPNASEARELTGEEDLQAAIRILVDLCPLVVVKDGPGGAYGCERGRPIVHSPALDLTPIDTTGAGDCFNAGFVRAWLDGQPLEECLRWGNVVGGLSTQGMGGTGRAVTLEDVRRILADPRSARVS